MVESNLSIFEIDELITVLQEAAKKFREGKDFDRNVYAEDAAIWNAVGSDHARPFGNGMRP